MNSAQTNGEATGRGLGGVTGRGFMPGQSGNPGGRAKGLGRRIREEVGEDGDELVRLMLEVLRSKRQPIRLRMEAATWLADRGFGKPAQTSG